MSDGLDWWLGRSDGRVRVGSGGCFLGRDPMCHVVLRAETASRWQAVVWVDAVGSAWVQSLGRAPTLLNRVLLAGRHRLAAGDRLLTGGEEFDVQAYGMPLPPVHWCVAFASGMRVAVPAGVTVLGGDAGSTIMVPGWHPRALRLLLANGTLIASPSEPMIVDGVLRDSDDEIELGLDTALDSEGVRVWVRAAPSGGDHTPGVDPQAEDPIRVHFRMARGRGGWLQVTTRTRSLEVRLAGELRASLVLLLIQGRGGWCDDEKLLRALYPGSPADSRKLDQVVIRTRRELMEQQVDGQRLIQRANGETRIRMAAGHEPTWE